MKMYRYKSSVADLTNELLEKWFEDWRAGKLVQDNLGEGQQPPAEEPAAPKEEPKCDSPGEGAKSYEKTMEM